MSDIAWSWLVALDGNGLDGLRGDAGLMKFEWPSKKLSYRFYDGLSAGHNPSLNPSGNRLLLGNFSQQLSLINTHDLNEISRQSTFAIEEEDYRLRANTHHLWIDDHSFIAAIGQHLYRIDLDNNGRMADRQVLGRHGLHVVHEMRWDSSHRYILMGDLGAEDTATRQVAIFDRKEGRNTTIKMPGTVWHVVVAPHNMGYAVTYNFDSENGNYVDWSPALEREYILEIDLAQAKVTRHFSAGIDFPIHLNSDLEAMTDGTNNLLYISSGGSHTVTELNLTDMATTRIVTIVPSWLTR